MTATHVPVLAGELIELLDPQPGEVAVDCTFGGGGHARLVADRLGPGGHADRRSTATRSPRSASPSSPPRSPCATRFIRADFADGARAAARRGRRSADLVYLDLGMSSMQVDTWERGFSYAYDAPLDMRMDPDAGARPRATSSTSGTSAGSRALLREYGEERYAGRSRARSCATARAAPIETTHELVEVDQVGAIPAPARFAGGHPAKRVVPGDPDRRQRRARRSSTRALPLRVGRCSRPTADLQGSPSTRSRTGA